MAAAIGAVAMLVPATKAGISGDLETARPFLYGGVVFLALCLLVGLSARVRPGSILGRGQLLSLLGIYVLLPVMLALPLQEAVPGLSFRNAYLEMVSSLTTTGATVFDLPGRVPDAVHLWRALVGWLGGLMIWIAAIAILAPLRLGGFEIVLTRADVGRDGTLGRSEQAQFPARRILRHGAALLPVYAGLTLLCWLLLLVAGETPFVAACHAMSAISTSGISPLATLDGSAGAEAAEIVLFCAMCFALSRSLFASDMPVPLHRRRWQDPELRIAAVLLLAVPSLMFAHHWVASLDVETDLRPLDGARAFWGSAFMTLSFLSTTGFISADWADAGTWSGVTTPGLIFMGLAMVGGGVATTAGGVKLLRVYALYKHGQFAVAKLVHPSLVAAPGNRSRRISPGAAYLAWLFFMIFALSVATIMTALSLTGVEFEQALVLTIAALTTTGPLIVVAGETPIVLATLDPAAQMILCASMVLGRLEALAIVALLNPDFWRN